MRGTSASHLKILHIGYSVPICERHYAAIIEDYDPRTRRARRPLSRPLVNLVYAECVLFDDSAEA
jgi:hypothetical protein